MIRNFSAYSRNALRHGASEAQMHSIDIQETVRWFRCGMHVRKWIEVPFKDQAEAKRLGAQRDGVTKQWFIPPHRPWAPFVRWLDSSTREKLKTAGEI